MNALRRTLRDFHAMHADGALVILGLMVLLAAGAVGYLIWRVSQ